MLVAYSFCDAMFLGFGFSVGGFELGLLPEGAPSVHGAQALWGVSNVKEEVEHLLSLGALALEPVTDVGEGIKVAAVRDPFGNRIGIIENPNFKPAEVR
jgi:predicted enzyme related to lactoylglutathione lyase